jgi:hypothetical protein
MSTQTARNHGPHDRQRREVIASFFNAVQAGGATVVHEVLTPDAITRWPESREQITGAMSCVRVYEKYPGGAPDYRVERITGGGGSWEAELSAQYGDDRWYIVSLIETDYFGPSFPTPDWRSEWVQIEPATPAADQA